MSWSSGAVVLAVAAGCLVTGCGGPSTDASRVTGSPTHPSTPTRHAHQSGSAAKPKSVPGSGAPSTAGHAVPTTGHAAGTNATDGGGRGQAGAAGRDVVALLAPGSY